jgi:hypothetical protein
VSHFYGTCQGGRSIATRCGHKTTGIVTNAASWSGAVTVNIEHVDGEDIATVCLAPWSGNGVHKLLYRGPVGEYKPEVRG